MALESAANFKAAIATAAADITTAWSDTVLTEIAAEIRNNHHPLRKLKKLFLFNAATGVVTANDAYIDACYAGSFPNVGTGFDKDANIAISLSTGTVEAAAPLNIVLTFNRGVTSFRDLSIGGTVTTAKAISSVSISGAVMTITVTTAYISTDTISVSGTFYSGLDNVTLADEAITNNVV
jgi:hypothetical protein